MLVADLDLADRSAPQLLMPRSGKGHANKRAAKMAERVRVQITPELAALLKQEAKGRAGDAPLLMRGNGEPWGYRRSDQYRREFAEVVTAAGLDPKTGDAVRVKAFKHLAGIAAGHLDHARRGRDRHKRERNPAAYAKLISDHSGEIMRRALLDVSQPSVANVVALKG